MPVNIDNTVFQYRLITFFINCVQRYKLYSIIPNVWNSNYKSAPGGKTQGGNKVLLKMNYFFLNAHHVASLQLPVPGAA